MIKELIALACCDEPTERGIFLWFFCLKLTYEHLQFQKFFLGGYIPGPLLNEKGGEGWVKGCIMAVGWNWRPWWFLGGTITHITIFVPSCINLWSKIFQLLYGTHTHTDADEENTLLAGMQGDKMRARNVIHSIIISVALYRICFFKIRPEPDLPDF